MPGIAAEAESTFHRPPRAWPDPPPQDELHIHAPPVRPEPPAGGILQTLFPVLGSCTMLGFALVYHNRLFLYLALGMVCLSLLFALGMRWSQWRQFDSKRKQNRRKYRLYLTAVERQLSEDAEKQLVVGDRLYPDFERLWGLVLSRRHLWERRAHDADFLHLRVGRGPVRHCRPLKLDLGDDPLADRERDLEDEASAVRGRWERVNDVPVVVDLTGARVLSLVGAPETARGLARSLVAQLVALRAPGDLRVLAATSPEDADEWDWTKWLPHARASAPAGPGAGPPLLLATSRERLSALLEAEIGPRLEQLQRLEEEHSMGGPQAIAAPRLVVVVDGFTPALPTRLPLLREVLERGQLINATAICLAESAGQEPSEADVRVELSPGAAATVEERGTDGRRWEGVWPDAADAGLCEALARALAPLRLEDREATRPVGDQVRALELHGVSDPEDIEASRFWRTRPRADELTVPLGLADDGSPVVLDLKQPAEGGLGPHGLIVGATGSGKSELLRTLVSGLALTHDPDTLSFVLIDYKGGAAFAEISKLPHAAGIVTNLNRDRSLVDRMRDALLGEQERRQAMLRDAGNLDDIRAYRRACESDPSLEPMPYLLVVVDEFGELLSSRPEFIDLFLGIGRVGRSLGMHLLFSSQRLEEGRLRGLESNLRYRICLRTYSAMESKTVLGTPDAYLLPPYPGLAYLKVDTAIYERFKVGLVTAPAKGEELEEAPAARVLPFELADEGEASAEVSVSTADEEDGGSAATDLDVLVSRLQGAAGDRQDVHQVWLPPLPREVRLADLPAASGELGVDAVVGLTDLPSEQRTEPLRLDFTGAGGHLAVVGAPQTGKSTVVRTLVGALARTHPPDHVQLYLLDLGGGGLGDLDAVPHVGGVASKLDPERVRQTVRHVQGLVEEREMLFRRLALASAADARARRARGELEEPLPDVFLIVDGMGALRRDFEGLDEELERLAGAGLAYGVHVVLTGTRWGEMRPQLRDQIGARLELRLNDPLDSEIGRKRQEAIPEGVPGRGLAAGGVEVQFALPDPEVLAEAAERWNDRPAAPPVPVLPLLVTPDELKARIHGTEPGVPLGLDELRLEPVLLDLTAGDPHFLVMGDGESGKTTLLRLVAQGLTERQDPGRARLSIIDYRRGLLDLAGLPHIHAYAANAAMASELAASLHTELAGRLPGPGASREELLRGPSWSGPRHYLLVDDYDLVPGAMDNPLAGLVDLLAHGRDIGLHVVLARRVGGAARSSFEPFFQRLSELRPPGLLMSGDPEEGPLIGGRRAMHLPPGRGQLIRRGGRASLVQIPLAAPRPAEQGAETPTHASNQQGASA